MFVGSFTVITDLVGGVGLSKLTNGKYTDEQITLVFGSFCVVFLVIMTCIASPEEQFTEDVKVKNPFREIYDAFKAVNKKVLGISLCFMFSRVSIFSFQTNGTDYFAVDIFHGNSVGDDNQKQNYNDGVSFGMLCNGIGAALYLLFGLFQEFFIKFIGIKYTFIITQVVQAVALLSVFFFTNRWVVFSFLIFLGLTNGITYSIPVAVVGIVVIPEKMGIYMSLVNSFGVIGELSSQMLLGYLGTLFPKPSSNHWHWCIFCSHLGSWLSFYFCSRCSQKTKNSDKC